MIVVAVVAQALVALLLLAARLLRQAAPAQRQRRADRRDRRLWFRLWTATTVVGAGLAAAMLLGVLPAGPAAFRANLVATVVAAVVALFHYVRNGKETIS